MGGLSSVGVLWAILSFLASFLISFSGFIFIVGVYLVGGVLTPEWLIGQVSAKDITLRAYFGSYKRCNYPVIDKNSNTIALAAACGRYESFAAIPSRYWQLSTVSSALGASLSLLLSLLLIPSICFKEIVNKSTALVLGFFQILAAVFIATSLVLYPLGWDNAEVKDACGEYSGQFALGHCQLGRSYIGMMLGSFILVICSLLSLIGGKTHTAALIIHGENFIRGYDNTRLDYAK